MIILIENNHKIFVIKIINVFTYIITKYYFENNKNDLGGFLGIVTTIFEQIWFYIIVYKYM